MATNRKKAASAAEEPKGEKAPARRRAACKVQMYVQYQGREISQEEVVEAVKSAWTGAPIKTLALYVKPEDGAVYYVVNGGEGGRIEF